MGPLKGTRGLPEVGEYSIITWARHAWVLGFAAHFGSCSSVKAELLALLKGLRLAKSSNFPKLIINMDSQVVVSKIMSPLRQGEAYFNIIRECQHLMQDPSWTVKLSHCYRESNKAADAMANLGVTQSMQLVEYSSSPLCVFPILFEDTSDVAWPRVVRAS